MSTGLWTNDSVPKDGWTCVAVDDLGAMKVTCQMCLSARIRYVHKMTHPRHHTLRTGVCCAGNMEGSVEGARSREHVFRLAQTRKARWFDREWKRAKSGVLYTNGDGFSIRIYAIPGGFGGVISSLVSDWRLTSKHVHPTEAAAQSAALKAMFTAPPAARAKQHG